MGITRFCAILGALLLCAPADGIAGAAGPLQSSGVSGNMVLVVFNSDPGLVLAPAVDLSNGMHRIASSFGSVNALFERYDAAFSRQMFAGTRLQWVYEFAVKGGAEAAVAAFRRDPHVAYARPSEPDMEARIKATIDGINAQTRGAWTAGVTVPGIMTPADQKKLLGGLPESWAPRGENVSPSAPKSCTLKGHLLHCASIPLPQSFDWRSFNGKNYVTPVKDQQSCGSCWAFAAVADVEIEANAYYNQLLGLDLSEQQILSCSPSSGDCVEGYTGLALNYAQSTGLVSAACFPYRNSDQTPCSQMCANPTYWKVGTWSWIQWTPDGIVSPLDEQLGLLEYGPFAMWMMEYSDFWYYTGGVYYPTPNANQIGGHLTAAVGYGYAPPPGAAAGSDATALYLASKNSWGTTWGEKGFFRIYYGVSQDNVWIGPVVAPAPPAPVEAACEDLDHAGHCYWGLGSRPANCPASCTTPIEYCRYGGDTALPAPCITRYPEGRP
ncbi:MAG: C1 family peptidase [Terracidiphilus sp.]